MAFGRMTLIRITFNRKTPFIIKGLIRMTFSGVPLSRMTPTVVTFSIITLSIMTPSLMTYSIMTLSIMTFSIKTFS